MGIFKESLSEFVRKQIDLRQHLLSPQGNTLGRSTSRKIKVDMSSKGGINDPTTGTEITLDPGLPPEKFMSRTTSETAEPLKVTALKSPKSDVLPKVCI